MENDAEVFGLILAGGKSRRFGRDKASEDVLGETSLARVRAAMEAVLETLVVGEGGISDLEPGGGPLQAILAGWRARPRSQVVVVACDMPFIEVDVIRRLAAPLVGEARVPLIGGRRQWLGAGYGRRAIARLEAAWEAGERSIERAMMGAVLEDLEVSEEALLDFDTEADLEALKALRGGPSPRRR